MLEDVSLVLLRGRADKKLSTIQKKFHVIFV